MKLLVYFLYGKYDWLTEVRPGVICIETGPATRQLRVRSADFWSHLYWLEQTKLIRKVEKQQLRGTVILHLVQPVRNFGGAV